MDTWASVSIDTTTGVLTLGDKHIVDGIESFTVHPTGDGLRLVTVMGYSNDMTLDAGIPSWRGVPITGLRDWNLTHIVGLRTHYYLEFLSDNVNTGGGASR